MTSGQIVPYAEIEKMALAVASSRMFGLKSVEQAISLMLIAQAEGTHPARAAQEYHIINNRPALRADAMLARFQAAGGRVQWIKYANDEVVGEFSHENGGTVTVGWTMAEAIRIGLPVKNPTWNLYPRAMLRSRVISEGVRTCFPGVTAGIYSVEELTDMGDGAATIDMGNAQEILPAVDPEILKTARSHASIGGDHFRQWWKNLTRDDREILTPYLGELKVAADAADKMTEEATGATNEG